MRHCNALVCLLIKKDVEHIPSSVLSNQAFLEVPIAQGKKVYGVNHANITCRDFNEHFFATLGMIFGMMAFF